MTTHVAPVSPAAGPPLIPSASNAASKVAPEASDNMRAVVINPPAAAERPGGTAAMTMRALDAEKVLVPPPHKASRHATSKKFGLAGRKARKTSDAIDAA